jgi:hypothetical protein
MDADVDLVEEFLGMAKEPDQFTRADPGEMILAAATEIVKLREYARLQMYWLLCNPES